jgi:nucleoside-diphosphate-sugar epimerase
MSLDGARILVRAAAGFIGSRLVEWLHEVEGAHVLASCVSLKTLAASRYPSELRGGDVTDRESLQMAARSARTLFMQPVSFAGASRPRIFVCVLYAACG